MTWGPIDTAPHDGGEVLVAACIAGIWIVRNAFWREVDEDLSLLGWTAEDTGWWAYRNSVGQEKLEDLYEPTLWMELPEFPEA